MKRMLLICAGTAMAWYTAHAQPPPLDPPAPPPEAGGDRAPPPKQGGPPPHVQRFFDMLRDRDPAEFDRLQELRNKDPEAFRRELRERLQEARERMGLQQREGMNREFRPPNDGREPGARKRGPGSEDPMAVRTPELDRLESKGIELARGLASLSGADRDRALEELRDVLSKAFDMRETLRRERLSRMQERLARAQTLLDERSSNRTAIIERRLRELSRDDPTAW